MQSIVFINSLGESVEINYSHKGPYYLQDFKGVGEIQARTQTESAPGQHGAYITADTMNTRQVLFKVIVLGEDMSEIYERRRYLSRVFNPVLGEGVLQYQNDYYLEDQNGQRTKKLSCVPVSAPEFPTGKDNQTGRYHVAIIELNAVSNPFFEDLFPTNVTLEQVTPLFEFELEIDDLFEVGSLAKGEIIIENDGDVSTPLMVTVYGPVTDPRLTLEETGQFIELETPLTANEKMIITTAFGNKRATVYRDNGTIEDGTGYLSLDSDFFDLQLGKNTLLFTASAGSETAVLDVSFSKQYVAL